jgi:hypothetical protein
VDPALLPGFIRNTVAPKLNPPGAEVACKEGLSNSQELPIDTLDTGHPG